MKCDVERERLDVGAVDEGKVVALETSRQETSLVEPVALGEIAGELDREVEIGRPGRLTRDPGSNATANSTSASAHTDASRAANSSAPSSPVLRRESTAYRHKTVPPQEVD